MKFYTELHAVCTTRALLLQSQNFDSQPYILRKVQRMEVSRVNTAAPLCVDQKDRAQLSTAALAQCVVGQKGRAEKRKQR